MCGAFTEAERGLRRVPHAPALRLQATYSGSDEHTEDALIMAGDVSDDINTYTKTIEVLSKAFGHVFVVPGNHDLWCRKVSGRGGIGLVVPACVCASPSQDLLSRGALPVQHERDQYDSLRKLEILSSVCKGLGVHTSPRQVDGVWIVPLLSWYHGCWDREPDVDGATPIHKASRSVALRRLQRLTAGRRYAYGAR